MKSAKKIVLLGLVIAMVLTSMVPAFALPGNTVVVGNKAFSMDYFFDNQLPDEIVSAINGGGDIYLDPSNGGNNFIDAWTGSAITDAQKAGLTNVEYLDHDGNTSTYANFDDKTPAGEDEEITVVGTPAAVNATTIEVTFSNDAVERFTVAAMTAGSNTRTVEYNGNSYTVTVTYTPPVVIGKTVEKVEFVNYRYIKVSFNGLVDNVSAADPANYYFEIVDGNAQFGALPLYPTLQDSNQLSKIETEYEVSYYNPITQKSYYASGADAWWNGLRDENGNLVKDINGNVVAPPQIEAIDTNGRTVVNIYFPEDARFTDKEDIISGPYPFPYFSFDAERTLSVEMRDSKTDGYTLKKLIKNTSVNVGVRNVKDLDGKLSIDTVSMPIKALDEVNPQLMQINKVVKQDIIVVDNNNFGDNLGSFNLLRTNGQLGQTGEELQFVYNEPVFDAHRQDMSDLDYYRDITLYVNGKTVASLSMGNLRDFMKFDMSKDSTYESSKIVTLDVEAAVKEAYKEQFATGIDYIIHFVGVTDLAGNIEVPSDHTFTVRFHDNPVQNPNIVTPVVLDVDQVADNIFRVEFNRADVEGRFIIENPDGEGQGIFYNTYIVPSEQSANGKYYSYVEVPACDNEDAAGIGLPQGVEKNQILAYDSNGSIIRKIRVEDVVVKAGNDPVAADDILGNNFSKTMTLTDDIKAPVVENPDDIKYDGRGTKIYIPAKDLTPWVADENIDYWVHPIAYEYSYDTKSFGNEIIADQRHADTYLPVKVSYVDADGAKHQALVSNYDLMPENGAPSDLNPGTEGNITFDGENDVLILDLADYDQLLDRDNRFGKLVGGATYTIEIPKGYFTDSPLDLDLSDHERDFTFSGYNYDILYVDDARDDSDYQWIIRHHHIDLDIVDAGLGYTSKEQTLTVDVEEKPAQPDPAQAVPQTSKQLINYDEPTDSMKIEFTGTIDVNTLKDKNNYSFNGKTLAQWDALLGTNTVIDYVVDNSDDDNVHQYAVFKIPQDSIQEYGNYAFTVQGVSHPNGGTMQPVTTEVRLEDNYRPVVTEAVMTGMRQIKLTFNEPIKYFVDSEEVDAYALAKNFLVKIGGNDWTVLSAVLPTGSDSDREITLNLGNDIPASGAITVEIVKDQNGNILAIDNSTNKNPLKTAEYDVSRP